MFLICIFFITHINYHLYFCIISSFCEYNVIQRNYVISRSSTECMFSLNCTPSSYMRRILRVTLCNTSVPFLEATIYIFSA